jgi:DNA polymerase/3'-5' exonuclease PolX
VRWLSILVLALALVAAGCGGGDDESSASDEPTIEETTTDEATTEEATDDETTEADLSDVLEDEDCLALAGVGASIAQAFSGAADSGSDADLEELASRVPEEIRADVEILARALGEYSEKLQDIGIETGATPTAAQVQELQAALASLDQQELTAASDRIQAWATANCEAAGG